MFPVLSYTAYFCIKNICISFKAKLDTPWSYAFQVKATKTKINFQEDRQREAHQTYICLKLMNYHFSNTPLSTASVLFDNLNHEHCFIFNQL